MTPEEIVTLSKYLSHVASALSLLACFWLFFKYIRQMDKGVKYLLIVILAQSDLIYSANHLLQDYWNRYKIFESSIGFFFDTFPLCFSIFWASAIAFIAYKNLADRYIDLKALFIKVLLVVLALALALAILASLELRDFNSDLWVFGTLAISLIFTIVFYQKGINILRDHLQYEQKSISRYIRNLKYFSGAQLLSYGPIIVLNFIKQTLHVGMDLWIWRSCKAFACLSGFLSVVVFACQGGFDLDNEFQRDYAAEEDLTSDLLIKS